MAQLTHKIKAFTILESMVAIVIVMLVFGLTSMVVLNVNSSGITGEEQKAYTLVKKLRNETLAQRQFLDETITVDQLTLKKSVLDYGTNQYTKILLIEAHNQKEKVYESKEIILIRYIP